MDEVMDLVMEANELMEDYGSFLDPDMDEEEIESLFTHGFDPELVHHARSRFQEIQSQIDL